MAYYKIEEQELKQIADTIREKTDTEEKLTFPNGFVQGIQNIETADSLEVIPLTISANDTYTAPEGQAYSPITVDVPNPSNGTIEITENGTVDVTNYASAKVNVLTNPDMYKNLLSKIIMREPITELPLDLTRIGDYAFYKCSNLQLTSLPNTIRTIGSSAFAYSNLTLTELPNDLNLIKEDAFANCEGLSSLIFPNGLINIDRRAFQNCPNLTSVIFKGQPLTIGYDAFKECSNLLDIYVPWSASGINEVPGAPWGATNATIHYNYTEEQP